MLLGFSIFVQSKLLLLQTLTKQTFPRAVLSVLLLALLIREKYFKQLC